jgi:hypothetical protein
MRGAGTARTGRPPALPRAFPGALLRLLALSLLAAASACAGRSGEPFPAPGWERGSVPGLGSARVLVLPLQAMHGEGAEALAGVGPGEEQAVAPASDGGVRDGAGELDRALMFALRTRAPSVGWHDAASLGEAQTARLGIDPGGLAVGVFAVGEVRRVGDPLFGDVYRLASLVDAELALLPVRGWWVEGEGGTRAVALHAALLAPRTGRVLWQGVVRGGFEDPGSPAPLVSAAEELAMRLLP